MTDAINYEQIGITNDVMFGSVFQNVEDCKELLQRILHLKIVELTIVEGQKQMNRNLSGKGIRLDIYVRDGEGNSYDIEMQLTDTGELDLRSRYYHSEMDSYQIRKGMKYQYLKQSIVIFVCGFDLFGENRSLYTFETICRDDEWRENYMTIEMKMEQRYEEGRKQGLEQGRKQGLELGEQNGRLQERISLIQRMIEMNYSREEILALGYSEAEYEEVEKRLRA